MLLTWPKYNARFIDQVPSLEQDLDCNQSQDSVNVKKFGTKSKKRQSSRKKYKTKFEIDANKPKYSSNISCLTEKIMFKSAIVSTSQAD